MLTDWNKIFDPQAMSQNMSQAWQKALDMNLAMQSGKVGLDSFQQMSGIWAKAFATCSEQQMNMCQTAMNDSIECLRDLSSAKGMDELLSKQAEWTKKTAEKCQTSAQTMAQTMQTCQTQCTDIITKMMAQNFQSGGSKPSKS